MSARYYISRVVVRTVTRPGQTVRVQLSGVEAVTNANGLAIAQSAVIPTDPTTGRNATSWSFSIVSGPETAHDVLRASLDVYELAGIVADETLMDAVVARLRSAKYDDLPPLRQTQIATACATVGELGPFAGESLAECCNRLLRRLGLRGASANVTQMRVVF